MDQFVNLTFDGYGLLGKPIFFWLIMIGVFYLIWKSSIYLKIYLILVLAESLFAYYLFSNSLATWLQSYVVWFQRIIFFVHIEKLPMDVKIFISISYLAIPIKLYLFIEHVKSSQMFTREFIISPIRCFKLKSATAFLNEELDDKSWLSDEQHSYFKMILYLFVLTVASLILLLMITLAASASILQPINSGGLAMVIEWNAKVLLNVIFLGTLYLTLKDWVIACPYLVCKLGEEMRFHKDNCINMYLNFKNRNK